jgi:LuxR family maltose regulon positive regulatory protein
MRRAKSPNIEANYFSARLTAKLKQAASAQTTLIAAPAGYGKTTAAREFLSRRLPKDALRVWFNCLEQARPVEQWRRFCRAVGLLDPAAEKELLWIGPLDDDTAGYAAAVFADLRCDAEAWLIIDDFHRMEDAVSAVFWRALTERGAENPHIVLLTRTPPNIGAPARIRHGVLCIGQEDLSLNEAEIGEYFERAGLPLTPERVREAAERTGGWIAALRLQMRNYLATGAFVDTDDIGDMFRDVLWTGLSPDEKRFLLRISPFEDCTLAQAAFMAECDALPEYAVRLAETNAFIREVQGSYPRRFRLHSTLLGFVRRLFADMPQSEQRAILYRAGAWCAENGLPEQAIGFYYRLRDFEKVLAVDVMGMEFETADAADMLTDVLEHTTPEAKLKHSAHVVKIVFMLFGLGRREAFARWTDRMDALAKDADLPVPDKDRLAGELMLLRSFTKYNDIAAMGALIRRSHALLKGRPSFISPGDAWTFGSASALFLYHAEPGRLDAEIADMSECCPYYCDLTRGHGAGGDLLFEAEAKYSRGDVGGAEIQAYKAQFRSESENQVCVGIGAALLLGRIAAYRGAGGDFSAALERIARLAGHNPVKSNRMEADMAAAFLHGLIDRPEDMADWLRRGDASEKRLFLQSVPFAQILYGQYLLQTGRPEIWLGMEEGARTLAERLRCQPALICGGILTAAAWSLRDAPDRAAAALKDALGRALPDRLYMPFAENRALLARMLPAVCPPEDLREITALADALDAGKAALRRPAPPFGLTERECEVARLAARKLSRRQIAETLFISENTVKSHLKAVYQKLDVRNRDRLALAMDPARCPNITPFG